MDDIGPPGEFLDDEFTREPLDPAKVATSTLKSLAGVARGALRRWRARHILLTVGVCALLAVTLLVTTGTAGQWWRQAQFAWLEHTAPVLTRITITPQPPGRRALSGWERMPDLSYPNPDVTWAVPAPNDPATFYGCSAGQAISASGVAPGPLTFWYSHDFGQHWSSVRLPPTKTVSCNVSVAPDAPERLILQGQLYSGCTNVSVFQNDDGGAHWHAIPSLPDAPVPDVPDNQCCMSFFPRAHHLYLGFSYEELSRTPHEQASIPHTALWRSDNGGHTWKHLDANLPPGSDGAYPPTLLDDGETLLLYRDHFHPPADGRPMRGETRLWISRDAGDSWEPWGAVQSLPVVWILQAHGSRAMTPSLAHPLYSLSGGSPAMYLNIQIAQVTDMRHWAPLPPLPIRGASPEHLGITEVLTETPSGKLLVFGLGPDDRVPSNKSDGSPAHLDPKPARQWLWQWEPQTSRWTLLSPAFDVPWPDGCSDGCWTGQIAPIHDAGNAGTYLWVTGQFWNGEQREVETFRILLPDPV